MREIPYFESEFSGLGPKKIISPDDTKIVGAFVLLGGTGSDH